MYTGATGCPGDRSMCVAGLGETYVDSRTDAKESRFNNVLPHKIPGLLIADQPTGDTREPTRTEGLLGQLELNRHGHLHVHNIAVVLAWLE